LDKLSSMAGIRDNVRRLNPILGHLWRANI